MPWTKVLIDDCELQETLTQKGLRTLSYEEALREAQAQLLERDERVFLMGEGIDDPGGVFGSTKGLAQRFGAKRVMDTPIAENGLTGIAAGAAMAGMRPVFIHMRTDFLPMCLDQIMNHAAKWHYMTGGRVNVPLTVRSIIGRGWGSAAQHSQALHGLFMNIPGLKIAVPATPYDAKGMLMAAVDDGNPVLFFEHRWIYRYRGYVPEEPYRVPFGKGIVRREGRDITVVAISQMVYEAAKAAKALAADGIELEIIDPRTVKPLDMDLISSSVHKTGRLIIADVACKCGQCGTEIVTRLAEEDGLSRLKAPLRRVCFPDAPVPASPVLEEVYFPDYRHIIRAAKEIMDDRRK